jgi:UDP-glucose 4-epimerase
MKILVTGGCGFIGSHLVDALVERGYEVVVVDDRSADTDKFYYNDRALYYFFSVCDKKPLNTVIQGCSFCFHLAAESRLQLATLNPQRAIEVNIGGTLAILEMCRLYNIGLVFSSTSSVYGLTDNLPIKETEKENCLNPYASSKYAAELLIRNYYNLHGVKSCILRYFNVFGERAPTKGQYATVTGIFLRQKKNNEPLTIVGDGTQKRDFIYVRDVVTANLMCLDKWELVSNAEPFNIGSATDVSVIELAKKISSDIVHISPRRGEAVNNLCSNAKFSKLTGWTPTVPICKWLEKLT